MSVRGYALSVWRALKASSSISKMGSSGINHQRITYQPGVGYTLKAVKAGGLSKKTSTAKVVQVRGCVGGAEWPVCADCGGTG